MNVCSHTYTDMGEPMANEPPSPLYLNPPLMVHEDNDFDEDTNSQYYDPALHAQAQSQPLLNISDTEWQNAQAYFEKNPNSTKFTKNPEDNTAHSFIKVGNQIFAMASRRCFGEEQHAKLGEGAFGKVKIVQTRDGENFAVKIEGRGLRGENDTETRISKMLNFTIGEAERRLGSKQQFKGKSTDKKLYTVMQLAQGAELEKLIYEPNRASHLSNLSLEQRLIIALKACKAVQELHDKGIIHADLKPANLIAKVDGTQVIISPIDFGLSMQLKPGKDIVPSTPKGSPFYMAPETRINSPFVPAKFTFASDVYALGRMFKFDLQLPDDICQGMLRSLRYRDSIHQVMSNIVAKLEGTPNLDPNIQALIRNIQVDRARQQQQYVSSLLDLDQATINTEYQKLRGSNSKNPLSLLMYQGSKNVGGSLWGKNQDRQNQIQFISDAFAQIKQDSSLSQSEKAQSAYAVLVQVQQQIKNNMLESGLDKFCEDKKLKLMQHFPELDLKSITARTAKDHIPDIQRNQQSPTPTRR